MTEKAAYEHGDRSVPLPFVLVWSLSLVVSILFLHNHSRLAWRQNSVLHAQSQTFRSCTGEGGVGGTTPACWNAQREGACSAIEAVYMGCTAAKRTANGDARGSMQREGRWWPVAAWCRLAAA